MSVLQQYHPVSNLVHCRIVCANAVCRPDSYHFIAKPKKVKVTIELRTSDINCWVSVVTGCKYPPLVQAPTVSVSLVEDAHHKVFQMPLLANPTQQPDQSDTLRGQIQENQTVRAKADLLWRIKAAATTHGQSGKTTTPMLVRIGT